jgi:hypothetical protein
VPGVTHTCGFDVLDARDDVAHLQTHTDADADKPWTSNVPPGARCHPHALP